MEAMEEEFARFKRYLETRYHTQNEVQPSTT